MALKALYRLNDLVDSSGNAFTLTNVGGVTFTEGKFANAANLGTPNTTKYLKTDNDLGIAGGAITILGWIKILAEPALNNDPALLFQSDAGVNVSNAIKYEDSGGTKRLNFQRGRHGVAWATSLYNVTLGTANFYHIAYTYDATNIRGYLNGVLVAGPTAASGNGSAGAIDNFLIGAFYDGSYYGFIAALVDEVSVYNEVLTAAQIFADFKKYQGNFMPFFM